MILLPTASVIFGLLVSIKVVGEPNGDEHTGESHLGQMSQILRQIFKTISSVRGTELLLLLLIKIIYHSFILHFILRLFYQILNNITLIIRVFIHIY